MFPHLSKIARAHAPQGLVVVGVSLERASTQLHAFVQQQGSNMEYAVCAAAPVQQCLNIVLPKSCPQCFAITVLAVESSSNEKSAILACTITTRA